MDNPSVKYGLMAGFVQIAVLLILYFIDSVFLLTYGSVFEYVVFIYFMVKAINFIKLRNENYISFPLAFRTGWLTYILAISITSVFTYILLNHIDVSLGDQLKQLQLEAFEKTADLFKLSEEEKARQLDYIENNNPNDIKSLAYSLPVSFLFPGAVIAVIVALFKKKERVEPQS
ncbi:MAG: DUF4199 domain-containing protein [Saprospiraceae bacterium]|nr:MAG: hypothetical protein UZ09_BCD002001601 [Bacteroidetes bacterium OLB9]MCO6463011.1 DUF4199 domain-containing protein [Saprospiraceae bacterium]